MLAQVLFEQGVARVVEFERVPLVNRRLDRAQVRGESSFGVDEVEFGDGACGQPDCGQLLSEFFREREEDARHLALLGLSQRL